MSSLEQLQHQMMLTIDCGPSCLPDGLFTGTTARVLAGLRIHANTISHARLIALEDSFPRTQSWLGHESFNLQCRGYIQQQGVAAFSLARIGQDFPHYLAAQGLTAAGDLARFEWHWLRCYHAAEAEPLQLASLAGLAPDAMLDVAVRSHPAAAMEPLSAAVAKAIAPEVPGLADSYAILIARPQAEVLVCPATKAMLTVFVAARSPVSLGNLLAISHEPAGPGLLSPDDCKLALIALLEAGGLIRTEIR